MIVGLLGALAGGFLAQIFNVNFSIPGHATITEIIIAFVGAVILLFIVQLFTGRGRGRRWASARWGD
jgi:uncharacterized membrane protein YeaQ/YmgE (transglycosylase-associated protein family)